MHYQELKNSLTQDAAKAPIIRDSRGVIRLFDNKNILCKKEEAINMAGDLDPNDMNEIKDSVKRTCNGVAVVAAGFVDSVKQTLEEIIKRALERNKQLQDLQAKSTLHHGETKDDLEASDKSQKNRRF